MVPVTITITRNTLRPEVGAAMRKLAPARLARVAGKRTRDDVQAWLYQINNSRPNKNGWPRSNFYAQAGDATTFTAAASGASVLVAKRGFRQRYYGGPIFPVNAAMLAIPLSPEAYGETPRAFNDLHIEKHIGPGGKMNVFLVRNTASLVKAKYDRKRRARVMAPAGEQRGEFMYLLVPSVNQEGDRTVIPPLQDLQRNAAIALREAFNLPEGSFN